MARCECCPCTGASREGGWFDAITATVSETRASEYNRMRQIADYELGELLGSGSHGRYFKAMPPPRLGLDTEWVAVKILARHASPEEFQRFTDEVQVFSALRSDYLASPLDAGQQDGFLFYTVPFYPDGSLGAGDTAVAPELAIRAVADAARGAHELHEVGLTHRGIKPSNILLDEGRGVLTDLELAQVLSPGLTISGSGPIASLDCMAPGRVLGKPATRATEIWELAATLHKALTKRSVMGDIPNDDVLAALRHVTATEPRVDASVAPDIATLIASCLSADSVVRPQTAAALAERLENLLA